MRTKSSRVALAVAGLVWLCGQPVRADVAPNPLISENMVLQQGIKVPLWGTPDEGEKVTVHLQGQEVSATAKGGKWAVALKPLQAGGPFEMTIVGKNTLSFKNVLVGEVWVASGQSNMEWPLRASHEAQKAMADSANPKLRLFTVVKNTSGQPLDTLKGKWEECGPSTVGNFSAVAYYFGRDLQKDLNVPVGLIHTSWGGTPAEAWTSAEALEAVPELKPIIENYRKAVENYPQALKKYEADLAEYKKAVEKAKAEDKTPPRAPGKPNDPAKNPNSPATLYNAMIHPLLPYGIKGAIWYQGESNAGRYGQYELLLSTMIKNWRQDWHEPEFPFLIVQLAPFMAIHKEPTDTAWARLRETQLNVTRHLPHTGLAVITDVGEEKDIHPKKKEPVGHRLAVAAEGIAYGKKIEYSGPQFESMKVNGNQAILHFTHVGDGLEARDGPLTGFTVAGEDHKFYPATAEIQGDTLVVSSPQVEKPVAVRFGWADFPVVNLWNKAGLPASPFRTDDWAQGK